MNNNDQLNDYDLQECIKAAVRLYGSDAGMEAVQTHEELVEWIGEDEVSRVVEELNK